MSLFEMITRKPEASNSFGFSDCNTCTHTHNRAYPLSGAVTIIVKQRAIATCRIVAAVATTWRFRTWEHGPPSNEVSPVWKRFVINTRFVTDVSHARKSIRWSIVGFLFRNLAKIIRFLDYELWSFEYRIKNIIRSLDQAIWFFDFYLIVIQIVTSLHKKKMYLKYKSKFVKSIKSIRVRKLFELNEIGKCEYFKKWNLSFLNELNNLKI